MFDGPDYPPERECVGILSLMFEDGASFIPVDFMGECKSSRRLWIAMGKS